MAAHQQPDQREHLEGALALRGAVALVCATLALVPEAVAADGHYLDRDGRMRHAPTEYRRRLEAMTPAHLLTLGEEALILGAGTLWYWLDDRNLADWDYPSWKERFTLEAWRYDNNEFPINFLGHTFNGATFYALPRANDLSVPVSATYALLTSFAWEFLIEFREKVSINDMLVTHGAGIPVGEFASKLWRYLNGVPHDASLAQRGFAAGVGFPRWVYQAIYGPKSVDGPYDDLGLSAAIGRYLEMGYRLRLHRFDGESAVTHGGWLGGRLSSIPGEGRPGSFSLFFHEADVVTLSMGMGLGSEARELELYTDTHLLGLYTQALDVVGDGHAGVVGLSLAYSYRFQDFDGYNDRLALLHMPGPGADYLFRSGPLELATTWRLNGDFAGIHSAAYSSWAADAVREGDRPKSILRKHNYYYGWGISSRLGASLRVAPFDLGARLLIGGYASEEGLDRTQEELTLDPAGSDRVLLTDTSLGFTVPTTSLRLGVGWGATRRWSRMEHRARERTLQTWSTSLALGL